MILSALLCEPQLEPENNTVAHEAHWKGIMRRGYHPQLQKA